MKYYAKLSRHLYVAAKEKAENSKNAVSTEGMSLRPEKWRAGPPCRAPLPTLSLLSMWG